MMYSRRICASFYREPVRGEWYHLGMIYSSAPRDAARLVETIHDFLDDAAAVFARSHDHCCICGRGLTDEVSRSRGIGPECVHKIPWVGFALEGARSIVVREQPSPSAKSEIADDEPFALVGRP
jgi:hypothetical protein